MAVPVGRVRELGWKAPAPVIVAGLAFLVCFWRPMVTLGQDWWSDPDAGHGILLFPVAVGLAWKRGLVAEPKPQHALGLLLLVGSVVLRYLSGLAAELFTMRMSMIGAAMGLVVYLCGVRQLVRWWLPTVLIILSVPLPAVVLGSLALPLQLKASQWGAALLESRHVPVRLAGNVIQLPGGPSSSPRHAAVFDPSRPLSPSACWLPACGCGPPGAGCFSSFWPSPWRWC